MPLSKYPRLIAIGVVAGVFSALFGVGGGIIVVPLLILVVKLAPRVAAGTSLAAIGITAAAGVVVYSFHGSVRPGPAAIVGLPAAAGAVVGTWAQQRVATRKLALAFAALLVAIAIRLLI
jgi:uncharacterized membrane protein YfcA